MVDIAICVTCYNNDSEIVEFAKSLSKQNTKYTFQLLVTCNSSNNFLLLKNRLQAVLPSAIVLNPNKNLGYLNGCLYGLSQINNEFRWGLITNTDITFTSNSFFDNLLSNVSDDIWCIGPDIILKDSRIHQNPFLINRPTRNKIRMWRLIFSNFLLFKLYSIFSYIKCKCKKNVNIMDSQYVYANHGCCFLLKNECIIQLLRNENRIFMYQEELLIAETIRANNKKLYYTNTTSIIHNESQVTSKIGNKKKQLWFHDSIEFLNRVFYKT